MGRYSCAIGSCTEKSYGRDKNDGVKFFHVKNFPSQNRVAVKKKILQTRKDIKTLDDIKDMKICSRHFPDGNKHSLPTIIPKLENGTSIWPDVKSRRNIARNSMDDTPKPKECVSLQSKLDNVTLSMTKTPPKLVQELEAIEKEQMDKLVTPVKKVHKELFKAKPSKPKKSPSLSQKLKRLREKEISEPTGVSAKKIKLSSHKLDVKDRMILDLQENVKSLEAEKNSLHEKLVELRNKKMFGIERFTGEPLNFEFYTNLPDYLTFLTLLDFLEPRRFKLNSLSYTLKEKQYIHERGREPLLSPENQLFLTLTRIRHGYEETDLAHRYDISQPTVSDIFSRWIRHMSHMLTQIDIWPTKELVLKKMPSCFKEAGYGETMCIVDCTEIHIQKPSNYALQSVTWSSYKNDNTAKALAAIAPHGPCIYVSDLYCGSASDHDITADCDLLPKLPRESRLMSDKGFECQDLCDPYGVRIDHPLILRGVTQMSEAQEQATRRIARVRIHVERLMERIKNNKILQMKIPVSMLRQLNDIWKVCCYLTHWLPPLLDDGEGH